MKHTLQINMNDALENAKWNLDLYNSIKKLMGVDL